MLKLPGLGETAPNEGFLCMQHPPEELSCQNPVWLTEEQISVTNKKTAILRFSGRCRRDTEIFIKGSKNMKYRI